MFRALRVPPKPLWTPIGTFSVPPSGSLQGPSGLPFCPSGPPAVKDVTAIKAFGAIGEHNKELNLFNDR